MKIPSEYDNWQLLKAITVPDVIQEVADWLTDNMTVEEICGEEALHDWAIENGYTKDD
jgi:hypothetical protein